MEKLKIIIADDHPIILLGVRELIERDPRFCITGEAACSKELIELLENKPADIIISDYNMPADSPYGDGLKLVNYLTRNYPKIPLIILTMISNELILSHLKKLGVACIIQKNQLSTEIEKTLKSIAIHLDHRSAYTAKPNIFEADTTLEERVASLSPREFEVLRLFVLGKSVGEIAKIQNRSMKTISAQKKSAMHKLKVSTEQDLLAYCLQFGAFN
ncbi:response regulator [Pseudomonas taiwanensis]|uniref:response regulator n=1 Tax=Pseudomonas taiwanensis TaxID=470150 RepID=UPI0028DFACCD|nr:response regulator [Pseudomonas taiwanensis]MDT8921770.1 response regulator [Pseudomonas taiwanensis]